MIESTLNSPASSGNLPKALFEAALSSEINWEKAISKAEANHVFQYFQQSRLFRWADAKNDCEDRAHAICLLLDSWGIPNYKGWVFSGAYLKRTSGSLINLWNYHVAAALPVKEGENAFVYIIDPSTFQRLATLYAWADAITGDECSYYLVRENEDYIFNESQIKADNWYKKNRQNYKWTMQGLAGVNGVTLKGKAQLVFKKKKIAETEKAFKASLNRKPF